MANELTVYQSRDGQEIKLSFDNVRKYLVSGHPEWVTDQEIVLYAGMCKARGLNPFKKDCFLLKYTQNDPAATIVSIDYYRARSKAQEDCVGWRCGVIVKTGPGQLEEREGSLVFEGEELMGGWFRARPKGWDVEKVWTVPLDRYIKTRQDGKITQFWTEEKQPEMICKVAEAQGLRRTWPDEFGKLYLKEEIVQGMPLVVDEPLKQPQPTNAPSAQAKTDSKVEDARQPSDGATKKAKPKDDAPKVDKKAEALKWISEVKEADFLDNKNWLNIVIKGMSQTDQLEVCTAWNTRNKQIQDELAAANHD